MNSRFRRAVANKFSTAKAGSFNEQNVGERTKSGMELGCAVVITCNHLFDDCHRSAVPKGQQAVFTSPCFVNVLCRSEPMEPGA